jgi:hypothetical protein
LRSEFSPGAIIGLELASTWRLASCSLALASFSDDFPPALHFAGLSIYPSVPLRANVFAAACI